MGIGRIENRFSFEVVDLGNAVEVNLAITETLPEGKCPVEHLRERLTTELRRLKQTTQELSV